MSVATSNFVELESAAKINEFFIEHEANILEGNPSVYVVTYAKYNAGCIEGMWVDLTTFDSYAEFLDFCHELHHDEVVPEFMFQDFIGFPREWYEEAGINEEVFDKILLYAKIDDKAAFDAYIVATGDDDLEAFEQAYMGEYDSEVAFAENFADESDLLSQIPENLRFYFDYGKFAHDLFITSYRFVDGYVFGIY